MRLFPSFQTIAVGGGLLVLMGWAYVNDFVITASRSGHPDEAAIGHPALSANQVDTEGAKGSIIANNLFRDVRQIDTSQFPVEVYGSRATVIVDFTAGGVQPCQQQTQILQRFAWENGAIKVVQVDVARNRQLAQQFRVVSLPTLVVVRSGEEVRRHVGLAEIHTLQSLVR